MSGMFWESEARPNICEAATGFTLSTIDLLVAIPMLLIDLAIATANNILREANKFNGTLGITYFKEKKVCSGNLTRYLFSLSVTG